MRPQRRLTSIAGALTGRLSPRRDEAGASALELAFLAWPILLLIFLMIQGSLYFYGRTVGVQAAREGVAQMRLAQTPAEYGALQTQVRQHTKDFAQQVGGGGINHVQVDFPGGQDWDSEFPRATVTVTGRTITLVPGLHLEISETVSGPIERFEADE